VHHCHVEGSVLFFPVTHPDSPDWPLTLVICRRKGGKPWYLLTNEPVQTAQDAWEVVLAYARRWQIELAFRNRKSELAIQSLRVYDWQARLKLLGLLTLAYAFLMDLMGQPSRTARDWLIADACHRSAEHLRQVELPFPASASLSPNCGWPLPVGLCAVGRCSSGVALLHSCHPCMPALLAGAGQISSCLLSHRSQAQERLEPLSRSWLPLFCLLLAFLCSGRRSFSLKRSSRNCREEEVISDKLFLSAVTG
jgi:hypothetical protein